MTEVAAAIISKAALQFKGTNNNSNNNNNNNNSSSNNRSIPRKAAFRIQSMLFRTSQARELVNAMCRHR